MTKETPQVVHFFDDSALCIIGTYPPEANIEVIEVNFYDLTDANPERMTQERYDRERNNIMRIREPHIKEDLLVGLNAIIETHERELARRKEEANKRIYHNCPNCTCGKQP